jgi:hypothetical protein
VGEITESASRAITARSAGRLRHQSHEVCAAELIVKAASPT